MQKVTWFGRNSVSGIVEVPDYESELKVQKCNMTDQNEKLLDLDEIMYSGVIEVADYKSEHKMQKLNMVDPIC